MSQSVTINDIKNIVQNNPNRKYKIGETYFFSDEFNDWGYPVIMEDELRVKSYDGDEYVCEVLRSYRNDNGIIKETNYEHSGYVLYFRDEDNLTKSPKHIK